MCLLGYECYIPRRPKNIDFGRKVIVLNDTKNRCQRQVPINESLEQVLKQYISYRNRIPSLGVANPDSHSSYPNLNRIMKTGVTDFAEYLESFFNDYLASEQGVSKHTVRSYRDTFVLLIDYMSDVQGISVDKLSMTNFSRDVILAFLNWLQDSRNNSMADAILLCYLYFMKAEPVFRNW